MSHLAKVQQSSQVNGTSLGISKTSHCFHCFFLKNDHPMNIEDQNEKFRTTGALKQHFKE